MNARNPLTLVDSSAWTQLLRKSGDPGIREQLKGLVIDGRAAWCELVRVELWRGAASEQDRADLREFEAELPSLELSPGVWQLACELGQRCREQGQPVPTTDLIIYACARFHRAGLLHRDRHFEILDTVVND